MTRVLLGGVVCLFLIQRGGLLLFGYSHIAHPGFDETASGVLTSDLLDGQLRAPLFAYQYEARSGDGLLEGFLLVPFFVLFGRSLFSLKLCALAAALVCLLCWIHLFTRYQGRKAALIFALLFTFPPLMFARLNLMGTISSHYLINVFMVGQMILLFRIMEDEPSGKMRWYWLMFGILAGLGSYTFYSYLIFNGFSLLFLLLSRPQTLSVARLLFFAGGFTAGISPWLMRTYYSSAGEQYLTALVKNLQVDWRSLVQNFFFNLPHSLGYQYPSREMGIISPLFLLFVLGLSGIVVRKALLYPKRFKEEAGNENPSLRSLAHLQGMFFVLFPPFFLGCLSLSPMKIGPFEYWPFVGFFGHGGVADVYRYRWLHPLFPFYFAIIAVGLSLLLSPGRTTKVYAKGAYFLLILFLLWGMVKGVGLYSMDDFGRVWCYKGYSYDQMANRFILSDTASVTLDKLNRFVANYPEENRGEAFRCVGTKVALELRHDGKRGEKLEGLLEEIGLSYLDDFIYGLVRSAQMLTREEFHPFKEAVVKRYSSVFYTHWGFRYLGYFYYDLFLNREKILDEITALERWFFRKELAFLGRQWSGSEVPPLEHILAGSLEGVPMQYHSLVIKGMGMLVGAEMLFDPLLSPDYPLDSRVGELFKGALQEAFYEGIGSGFAETLCRFSRTFMHPGEQGFTLYQKTLNLEEKRYHTLRQGLSSSHLPSIEKGLRERMGEKSGRPLHLLPLSLG